LKMRKNLSINTPLPMGDVPCKKSVSAEGIAA
jgi:hypothetical protein